MKKLLTILILSFSFTSSAGVENARLFDFGVTYDLQGGTITGSDGLKCYGRVILTKSSNLTCNNQTTYRQCGWIEDGGINKDCGSDGTSYWIEGNCLKSSFGSTCCGSVNFYNNNKNNNGHLTCNTSNSQSEYVYISDQVDIPIRSDKAFGTNIIRSLPSGTKLSILQITDDNTWAQVKYKDTVGWIIASYLSKDPPAREEVKKLKAEIELLKKQVAFLEVRKEALSKRKAKDTGENYQDISEQRELLEIKVKEAEAKALEAAKRKEFAEAKAREAEVRAQEAAEQKDLSEAKAQEAEEKAQAAVKFKILAEEATRIAIQLTEVEQQKKNQLEAERAAEKEAFEKQQYNRLLTQAVQDEQDLARTLIIEDQLNTLRSAYINNITARVYSNWRYQGAETDWSCDVYVQQDRNGRVEIVNVQNCNTGDTKQARAFKDSIERAVYKTSPFPVAPDDAVFDREILFRFVAG